ncbi:MAG TPA: hypothetical protein VL992_18400 [Tepidisphaeraceae bacterium]|nr:hypothetical protein [Tepidisphaeraceae bacterium]
MALASTAFAQRDESKAEDWKKMYEDASTQLRAAQNRKAELASDNAKLTAQLEKRSAELDQLRHQTDTLTEQTSFLTAFYADWKSFIRLSPWISDQWTAYFGPTVPELPDPGPVLWDPAWPLGRE